MYTNASYKEILEVLNLRELLILLTQSLDLLLKESFDLSFLSAICEI